MILVLLGAGLYYYASSQSSGANVVKTSRIITASKQFVANRRKFDLLVARELRLPKISPERAGARDLSTRKYNARFPVHWVLMVRRSPGTSSEPVLILPARLEQCQERDGDIVLEVRQW